MFAALLPSSWPCSPGSSRASKASGVPVWIDSYALAVLALARSPHT